MKKITLFILCFGILFNTVCFAEPVKKDSIHVLPMIAADVVEYAVFEAVFGTDPIHCVIEKTTGIKDPFVELYKTASPNN